MNRRALVLACSLFCASSVLRPAQAVGPSTVCTGAPFAQTPVDVTAKLSKVGAGITVTQATNLQSNWNTYSDIPEFSPLAGILTYNSFGSTDTVTVANLNGTNAQTISGAQQGTETYVTVDGKFVYYQGQNTNQTADLYAVPISQGGACRQIRLSNLNWVPAATPSSLVISTSSVDPATGKNAIAFSEGNILHRVLDDGTALPDLNLPDPENGNVFHRMRLNPVFPNIMWYKRDAPLPNPNGTAEPEIWVIDLNSPKTVYSLTGTLAADHNAWSPDGTQIGYHDENGNWYVADVLNPDGSFKLTGGAFTSRKAGPPPPYVSDADYCVWAPDGSVFVCTAGIAAQGVPLYLMSLDGTRATFLTATDSTGTDFDGIPKASFLDMQHIVFSSDRSGTPQVYVVTGFSTAGMLSNVNAASYSPSAVAPNSIVTASGSKLASATVASQSLPLPTQLGGVTVTVADSAGVSRQAALYLVSPQQINYVMPDGLASGQATVTASGSTGTVTIASVAPGVFSADATGKGLAAATILTVHADGTTNTAAGAVYDSVQQQFVANPIAVNNPGDQVYLTLYGTGIAERSSVANVKVLFNGASFPVTYAGPQPQFPGLDQVNMLLPTALAGRGSVNLVLNVDNIAANLVTLTFR